MSTDLHPPESSSSLMPLAGKVAVIFGGSRGIGRATALTLASAGATVVIAARSWPALEAVVAETVTLGGKASAHRLDVSNAEQVAEFAGVLKSNYGRIDILVNSAGAAFIAALDSTSEEDWDLVIDTNLKGTYLCTRALLDLLRASQDALIVNIASKVGLTGHAMVTAYTAAKAGVIGFSRALAHELSTENIRVIAICPGPVDTPMRWEATPKMDPGLAIPANSIAKTILFLAGLSSHVTSGEIVLEAIAYNESAVPLED